MVEETYQRSLPAALTYFLLGLPVIFYQFNSAHYVFEFILAGTAISSLSLIRAIISFLCVRRRIAYHRYLPLLQLTINGNTILWSYVFCLIASTTPIASIEMLISFLILTGICAGAVSSLMTVPKTQSLFFIMINLVPAAIYTERFWESDYSKDHYYMPLLLCVCFFYFYSQSLKLRKMYTKTLIDQFRFEDEHIQLENTLVELKTTQKALLEEKAKSLNAERLSFLGNMASGIAHEINNPLMIASGQIYKIQELLTEIHSPAVVKSLREFTTKINDMFSRIQNIILGLQTFAREQENVSADHFQLSELIHLCTSFLAEKIKKRGIELKIQPIPDIQILCRKNQIAQTIVHLLNNSIEALETSSHKKIVLDFIITDKKLRLFIKDSGPGISPEIQHQIFDPFFTTKDVGQGTGLGLSVSRGIAQSHGGDLYFLPRESMTTFVLEIPHQQDLTSNKAA